MEAVRYYRKREDVVLGAVSVIAFALLWEMMARIGVLDPFYTSMPSDIGREFVVAFVTERDIYRHLSSSFYDMGMGFLLSVVVGTLLGLVIGRARRVRYLLDPFLMAMYSTPTVAFLPVLILWMGIGSQSRIVLIFSGGVFAVLITTAAGVENIDPRLVETARAFRATRFQIFTRIVLPGSVPYVLAGIRLAIGRVLIMMFVAEMFMSSRGLGFMVTRAGTLFQPARMFVGIVILALIGIVGSHLVRILEERRFAYR